MYVLLKGHPAILKIKPALEPGRDAVEARIDKPLRIGIIPTLVTPVSWIFFNTCRISEVTRTVGNAT